jgi:chitin synthase
LEYQYDEEIEPGSEKVRDADHIKRVHACATMWHETPNEMKTMLKSVFRMDSDQAARRNAQKHFKVVDPDYYGFEGD